MTLASRLRQRINRYWLRYDQKRWIIAAIMFAVIVAAGVVVFSR